MIKKLICTSLIAATALGAVGCTKDSDGVTSQDAIEKSQDTSTSKEDIEQMERRIGLDDFKEQMEPNVLAVRFHVKRDGKTHLAHSIEKVITNKEDISKITNAIKNMKIGKVITEEEQEKYHFDYQDPEFDGGMTIEGKTSIENNYDSKLKLFSIEPTTVSVDTKIRHVDLNGVDIKEIAENAEGKYYLRGEHGEWLLQSKNIPTELLEELKGQFPDIKTSDD